MSLSTFEGLILAALFALALSGMLWVAWLNAPLRRVVPAFLSLFALAAVDAALIINLKPNVDQLPQLPPASEGPR